jgi:hypothetical protein
MKHVLLLTFAAASLMAADATGTWIGTLTPSGDREPGPAYLVLKQDGAKLTGTVGPRADEQHPIENGKTENGNLTFDVATGDSTMKFTLKHEGDEIKGDVKREHDGETQTAKLAVKRDKP